MTISFQRLSLRQARPLTLIRPEGFAIIGRRILDSSKAKSEEVLGRKGIHSLKILMRVSERLISSGCDGVVAAQLLFYDQSCCQDLLCLLALGKEVRR